MTHKHFIIHKPFGMVSQFKSEWSWKKVLGELYDFPPGTMAIGRLDEESEGLLLLTTDGQTSERIRSKNIEKEYYVQVDGLITEEALEKLRQGVEIGLGGEKYTTSPCKVFRVDPPPAFPPRIKKIRDDRHGPTCWISITLTEGKNRQIRKMTAAAGFPTLRLFRVRIGKILIGSLMAGQVIETDYLDV
jgi:23S rRNA pseudouridine2457 synthase